MIRTTTLGFPRTLRNRELEGALASYGSRASGRAELLGRVAALRAENLALQRRSGIDVVTVGDFSLDDHVLDAALMLGAVPERFRRVLVDDSLERYFLMARGRAPGVEGEVAALSRRGWFDTSYQFLVPEVDATTRFAYTPSALVDALREAIVAGYRSRPMLLGPVSFLRLARNADGGSVGFERLYQLLDAYEAALVHLTEMGAECVQLDEPCLVEPLDHASRVAYRLSYRRLAEGPARIFLATYFGALGENLELALSLPVHTLGVDALAQPEAIAGIARGLGVESSLCLGVVDGRGASRADLGLGLALASSALEHVEPERLLLSPSCSLLHAELALVEQKLSELELVRRGVLRGPAAIAAELEAARDTEQRQKRSSGAGAIAVPGPFGAE